MINPAHLHLIINHAPIFSILFGTLVLIIAILRNSKELLQMAAALFIIGALTTVGAHLTGDGAEDVLKKTSGLVAETLKHDIEEHEEASDFALGSSIIVAVISLTLLWFEHNNSKHAKKIKITLLVFAIHSCTVMARVAYLGGLIRHPEIAAPSAK